MASRESPKIRKPPPANKVRRPDQAIYMPRFRLEHPSAYDGERQDSIGVVGHNPSAGSHNPSAASHNPSADSHNPSAGSHTPSHNQTACVKQEKLDQGQYLLFC